MGRSRPSEVDILRSGFKPPHGLNSGVGAGRSNLNMLNVFPAEAGLMPHSAMALNPIESLETTSREMGVEEIEALLG